MTRSSRASSIARAATFLFAFAAIAPISAAAGRTGSVAGSLTVEAEEQIAITAVAATQDINPFDGKSADVVVVLSDRSLRSAALRSESKLIDAMNAGAHILRLRFDQHNALYDARVYSRETPSHGPYSVNSRPHVEITVADGDEISAHVTSGQTAAFPDEEPEFDVTFRVAVRGAVTNALQQLSAGGGAPGEAYLAFRRAVAAADLAAIHAQTTGELTARTHDEDFIEALPTLARFQPTSIDISGGACDAGRAWLQIVGDWNGERRRGFAELARVDGQWKTEREVWW